MVIPSIPPLLPQAVIYYHLFVVTITLATVIESNPVYLHFQALFNRLHKINAESALIPLFRSTLTVVVLFGVTFGVETFGSSF